MATEDADELVAFQNVRLIGSTAQALFCQIGKRRVWLPRRHTSGKLYGTGDLGQLLIRRWVACDRHLLGLLDRGAPPSITPIAPARSLPGRLHLVRRDPGGHRAS
jgi:hypothetical protein